jgi:hypothetical protein
MRPLQALRHSLQNVSSTHYIAHPRSIALSVDGLDRTASRHDAQMLTARTVPADPYTVWLERREADRNREERLPERRIRPQRCAGGPAIRGSASGDQEAREHDDPSDRPASARLITV